MNTEKYAQLHGDQEKPLWYQIMKIKKHNNIGMKNTQNNKIEIYV